MYQAHLLATTAQDSAPTNRARELETIWFVEMTTPMFLPIASMRATKLVKTFLIVTTIQRTFADTITATRLRVSDAGHSQVFTTPGTATQIPQQPNHKPSASLAKKRTTTSDGQSATRSTCSSSIGRTTSTKTMKLSSLKAPPSLL